jgi:hypothetical protein
MSEIVKINKLELASELAHDATLKELLLNGIITNETEMFVNNGDNTENYTDEAQDVFNDHYEYFLNKIESL